MGCVNNVQWISQVVNLTPIYEEFARYLAKESDEFLGFLDSDYDDLIRPIIEYIAKYGYSPPADYYSGILSIDDDALHEILIDISRRNDIALRHILYLTNMISHKTNHCPEIICEKHISRTGGDSCEVLVRKVSNAHWMFYTNLNQ